DYGALQRRNATGVSTRGGILQAGVECHRAVRQYECVGRPYSGTLAQGDVARHRAVDDVHSEAPHAAVLARSVAIDRRGIEACASQDERAATLRVLADSTNATAEIRGVVG